MTTFTAILGLITCILLIINFRLSDKYSKSKVDLAFKDTRLRDYRAEISRLLTPKSNRNKIIKDGFEDILLANGFSLVKDSLSLNVKYSNGTSIIHLKGKGLSVRSINPKNTKEELLFNISLYNDIIHNYFFLNQLECPYYIPKSLYDNITSLRELKNSTTISSLESYKPYINNSIVDPNASNFKEYMKQCYVPMVDFYRVAILDIVEVILPEGFKTFNDFKSLELKEVENRNYVLNCLGYYIKDNFRVNTKAELKSTIGIYSVTIQDVDLYLLNFKGKVKLVYFTL